MFGKIFNIKDGLSKIKFKFSKKVNKKSKEEKKNKIDKRFIKFT